MKNIFRIAKKEYAGFINNPLVLIVLSLYVIYCVLNVNQFLINLNKYNTQDLNEGVIANVQLFSSLTWTCCIVGIIIGCSTISSERIGKAMNTLATKPVYRDTIINGKIVGAVLFLASIIGFIMILSTAILLIFGGNTVLQCFDTYVFNLPFIFAFSICYVMVFLAISMLISLLVKEQSMAMILNFLIIVVSSLIFRSNVVLSIDNVLPGYDLGQLCSTMAPEGVILSITSKFYNYSPVPLLSFAVILPDIVRLFICAFAIMVLCYIVFIVRDIS